jgi:uncharacterized Ntn-hydrolase superfamily protein
MKRVSTMAILLAGCATQDAPTQEPWLSTFSIVCRDPKTGDFGVAVTTMPQRVRQLCPFARAGVGAVATQAQVNVSLGERGLALMAEGKTPQQALNVAIGEDNGRNNRQLAMIDGKNPPFAYTGGGCQQWAGHRLGKDYSTQGNILVSQRTLDEVARVFEETPGSLAGRMIAALRAGKAAGGDKRGHNSCAVIVASKRAPEGQRYLIDLSEDNNPDPVERVAEKFQSQCKEWFELGDREIGSGDGGPDVKQLEEALKLLGHFEAEPDESFDAVTRDAVAAFRKKARVSGGEKVDAKAAAAIIKAAEAKRR